MCTILDLKLKALNSMNNSGLQMISMILGREVKVLVAMNNSGLWMT